MPSVENPRPTPEPSAKRDCPECDMPLDHDNTTCINIHCKVDQVREVLLSPDPSASQPEPSVDEQKFVEKAMVKVKERQHKNDRLKEFYPLEVEKCPHGLFDIYSGGTSMLLIEGLPDEATALEMVRRLSRPITAHQASPEMDMAMRMAGALYEIGTGEHENHEDIMAICARAELCCDKHRFDDKEFLKLAEQWEGGK